MHLFLDIETRWSSKDKYSLKDISTVEYCRDIRFLFFGLGFCDEQQNPEWYSGANLATFFQDMEDQVGWKNIDVVSHNAKFDWFAIKTYFPMVNPRSYIDTKGMSRAVHGKSIKNHSLSTLAEHYKLPSKGVMKTDGLETLTEEQEKELAEYCLHDVWLAREIFNRLKSAFPESQYSVMSQTIDMFVNPKLMLNVPLLEKTAKEEAIRRETIFKEIGIDKKEFASNKKFPALLVSKGYEVPTKPSPKQKNEDGTPKQIPAIALGDPEFLELLESENEELKKLCEARVAAKSTLLETRSSKLAAIGRTGPWPFDVEFSGADQTHRFSGGSGAGGNPQNFTRDSALREAVQAPQGYSLIVGDFSNIELRIVAYLAKDPRLMGAIEKGTDLYCDFASAFFGRPITKANKDERQFGKVAILGLGYGMGAKKFKKTVRLQTGRSIIDEDAWKAVKLYRSRYPLVPALWEEFDRRLSRLASNGFSICVCKPEEPGKINLPSGLQIQYPNLRPFMNKKGYAAWQYDAYSKGRLETRELYGGKVLENISQALASEICKEAMLKIGTQVVGQSHDEIMVLAKKGTELVTINKVKRAMTTSPLWFPEIRLAVEIGSGQSWGECK